jgi:RNA polymerase-interacting CarD/CdnL/TRCF family regulator
MERSRSGSLHTLAVGSRVFCPGRGVARVLGIEERVFGGEAQAYYVLELEADRAKLMLPVGKVAQARVRDLVSAVKARALMKTVVHEPSAADVKFDPTSRRLRAASHSEALRSGSADLYTQAVRELLLRFRSGKLSPGEQQTLQQALTMFVGEISAALDRTLDDVRADLRARAELPATGW